MNQHTITLNIGESAKIEPAYGTDDLAFVTFEDHTEGLLIPACVQLRIKAPEGWSCSKMTSGEQSESSIPLVEYLISALKQKNKFSLSEADRQTFIDYVLHDDELRGLILARLHQMLIQTDDLMQKAVEDGGTRAAVAHANDASDTSSSHSQAPTESEIHLEKDGFEESSIDLP